MFDPVHVFTMSTYTTMYVSISEQIKIPRAL
jgi:hypothetical protein